MRRFILTSLTALVLSLPAFAADEAASCGRFGTTVEFVASPSEAAQQARQQEKLVLILHVSGLFEDPGLT